MTLDAMQLPACHLLKIDVEGMEAEVVQGARATIAAHRPVLYVENDQPGKSAELISLLFPLRPRTLRALPVFRKGQSGWRT